MLDLRYIFTVPCVMSLVGDLTVVHVQGRVHARAWPSSVVSSFKGADESRADSANPSRVPVQSAPNSQLHLRQLIRGTARAAALHGVFDAWSEL